MDERSIPSAAIYAGSLAHTFEYRTTGIHATPHLHWSFPLKEGATITCPILVAEGVVYVGDSAGFLSALDARRGDLLWCFATDWALDEENADLDLVESVTAFCLAGRLAYVASNEQMLYEVDLSNGQKLRSWDEEALHISNEISLLLFYDQLVWFNDWESISCLDPATGSIAPELFLCSYPIIYHHPRGSSDVIYGTILEETNPPFGLYSVFLAINLSLFGSSCPLDLAREDISAEDATLWFTGEGDDQVEVCDEICEDLYTVMDETFYAVCNQVFFDDEGTATHTPPNGTRLPYELRALDPFTGAVQWRYTIPKGVSEGFIQLAAASHLIFLVLSKGVEAIDTHTHQRRWKWTSNDAHWHILVADGLLFVLDEAGQITALDVLTGEQRWHWQTEQPIKEQFSTIADATLYLVMDHTLCAFR
ncbi:MAG TPA: PQQ-binding-like beta-propeller repeat protein [Ktedonobacteraceae bacterium]